MFCKFFFDLDTIRKICSSFNNYYFIWISKRFREFTGDRLLFCCYQCMEPSASRFEVFNVCVYPALFPLRLPASWVIFPLNRSRSASQFCWSFIQQVVVSLLDRVGVVSYRISRRTSVLFCILLRLMSAVSISGQPLCHKRLHPLHPMKLCFLGRIFAEIWDICLSSSTHRINTHNLCKGWDKQLGWLVEIVDRSAWTTKSSSTTTTSTTTSTASTHLFEFFLNVSFFSFSLFNSRKAIAEAVIGLLLVFYSFSRHDFCYDNMLSQPLQICFWFIRSRNFNCIEHVTSFCTLSGSSFFVHSHH